MLNPILSKLSAKFCPLAKRLSTSQGRYRTQIKEVKSFPEHLHLATYKYRQKAEIPYHI